MPAQTKIKITDEPEVEGVSDKVLGQFVGLEVSLSQLPEVAYYGKRPLPEGAVPTIVIGNLPSLDVKRGHFILSIRNMLFACHHAGNKQELYDWLKEQHEMYEYIAIDSEFCCII
jgi:hypothetical protein